MMSTHARGRQIRHQAFAGAAYARSWHPHWCMQQQWHTLCHTQLCQVECGPCLENAA
jgi:hypothetical protein